MINNIQMARHLLSISKMMPNYCCLHANLLNLFFIFFFGKIFLKVQKNVLLTYLAHPIRHIFRTWELYQHPDKATHKHNLILTKLSFIFFSFLFNFACIYSTMFTSIILRNQGLWYKCKRSQNLWFTIRNS